MKKTATVLATVTFVIATFLTVFVACENKDNDFEVNDHYACIYPDEPWQDDTIVEDELPPELPEELLEDELEL